MAVDSSGSQVIQKKKKIHAQEDSDSNFQPYIQSAFNYAPCSNPFEDFKKKSDIFCNCLLFLYMNK
jgi:hypothetical protein